MTSRYDIQIGSRTYPSKAAGRRRARSILAGDEPLDQDFLIGMVSLHPRSDEKIGCGISEVRIINPGWPGRCFGIVRLDGSTTDVSYLKCFGRSAPDPAAEVRQNFVKACREAIVPSILDFKHEIFPGREGWVECPLTGKPLFWGDCHIDHAPPQTFAVIVASFIRQRHPDLTAIPVTGLLDGQTRRSLPESIAAEFRDFHDQRATLRAIDSNENLRLGSHDRGKKIVF